jgi:hypothetical protein
MINTCKNSQDLPDILMATSGEVLAPPGCERCLCQGAAGRNSQARSRAQTAVSALSGGKRAIFCDPQLAGSSPLDPWGRSGGSGVVSPGAGVGGRYAGGTHGTTTEAEACSVCSGGVSHPRRDKQARREENPSRQRIG